jgi:hypothetical protein
MDTNDLIRAVEAAAKARYEGPLLNDLFRGSMAPMPTPVKGQSSVTMEIKRFFHDLAKPYDFDVTVAGIPEAYGGEWLYDLAWHAQANGFYHRQVLVLETETKPGRTHADCDKVDGDFHKLVQARADIRVWVASLPSAALREKHLENCKLQIDSFSQGQPGDYYLFVLFDWTSRKTTVDGYRRQASRPLSQEGAHIRSVSDPAVL